MKGFLMYIRDCLLQDIISLDPIVVEVLKSSFQEYEECLGKHKDAELFEDRDRMIETFAKYLRQKGWTKSDLDSTINYVFLERVFYQKE